MIHDRNDGTKNGALEGSEIDGRAANRT